VKLIINIKPPPAIKLPTLLSVGRDDPYKFTCHGLEPWQTEIYAGHWGRADWERRFQLAEVPIGTYYLICRSSPAPMSRDKKLDLFVVDGKASPSLRNQAGFIDNSGKLLLSLEDYVLINVAGQMWRDRPATGLDEYIQKILRRCG
jgi:hypothetical protein